MRCVFDYACHVGAVTLEGGMTTMLFDVGDVIQVVTAGCLTLEERTHQDFELDDGTLLLQVPLTAIHYVEDLTNV